MKCSPFWLAGLLLLAVGCSSTREIETSPPRSPSEPVSDETSETQDARLTIVHEPGETTLPDEIEELHFRISEIQIRSTEGTWIRLISDMPRVEIRGAGRGPRRTVLDTRVAPSEYDSVALSFDQIFARFDTNAGAPLTVAKGEPLRFELHMNPTVDAPTTLIVRLEAGATLRRTPDCRWFFVPVVRAEIKP